MQLSKSQYMRGLQCPKVLWMFKHHKELMAEPDAWRQHLFDTGHRVGKLAQQLFPGVSTSRIARQFRGQYTH